MLREIELGWDVQVGILMVLGGYVRNAAQLATELAEGHKGTGLAEEQVEQAYGRVLAKLIEPTRFPDAAKLFGSGLWEASPAQAGAQQEEPDFTFGLKLILHGVATAVEAT